MDKEELMKLSPSKRILLAQELWDSVPETAIPLTDPIKKELDSRLESHRKKEMEYFTPAEIKQKLTGNKK